MLWRVFISTVCALLCTLVALVAAPSTRRKTCEILAFLFGVPAFSLFIAFDLWAPSWNPLVGFPRNGSELMADPVAVMRLLKADGAVPQGAELVGLVTDGVLSAEPAKNAQISRLRLTYSSLSGGGPPVVLRLFVKYQAERGTTLLARALAAVYSPMHTEVGFYTRIVPALAAAPGSPRVPAPRCLAARYSRAFGRVLTVLETLGDEYEATPDWKVRVRGRQGERTASSAAATVRPMLAHPPAYRASQPATCALCWRHRTPARNLLGPAGRRAGRQRRCLPLPFGRQAVDRRPRAPLPLARNRPAVARACLGRHLPLAGAPARLPLARGLQAGQHALPPARRRCRRSRQ